LRVTPVRELVLAQYTVLGWEVADISATVAAMTRARVKFEQYGFPAQDAHGIWSAPGLGSRIPTATFSALRSTGRLDAQNARWLIARAMVLSITARREAGAFDARWNLPVRRCNA
jgi:hypothetical protein